MPTLIGDEIRRQRLRSNMTSKRLADEILLSEQYLSDIQKGRRLPSIDTLLVICNVFPDADSGKWLWLLLRDTWGDPAFNVMWSYAKAMADQRDHGPTRGTDRCCPACNGNLTGGGDDWCDCPGGDDPVAHPFQRRASWSGDYWCAVDGCTTKPSAHPLAAAAQRQPERRQDRRGEGEGGEG